MIYEDIWMELCYLQRRIDSADLPSDLYNELSSLTESFEYALARNIACEFCPRKKEVKHVEEIHVTRS